MRFMKFFACLIPLMIIDLVWGHHIGSIYYYKDKSFLGSLELVMRHTAQEIASFIEEYGALKKKGANIRLITVAQEYALFSIDSQFDEFYKAVDNDDEVCDKLLVAFVGRTDVLALPYLSTLFMHKKDLQSRLERWMTPNAVAHLQKKFHLLKDYIEPQI